MAYFALIYDTVDGYAERRTPFRDAHLALVRDAHGRGEIAMAGALDDPPRGALFVFHADAPAVAEAFARTDPYVLSGLVTRWTVRPWHVVVGP
jgi:uncharacterized protein YciI